MVESSPFVWFAMSATFGRGLKAMQFLDARGIESFIPMRYELVETAGGRKRKQLVPAVKNLIFVHTTREIIQETKQKIAYLQYLTFPKEGKREPIVVRDKDMDNFIAATRHDRDSLTYFRPGEMRLEKGMRVKVLGGPFDQMECIVLNPNGKRKKRFVVEIPKVISAHVEIADYDLLQIIE